MNYIDPLAKLMGEWSWNITVYSILLRVIIPFIFAFYVGCERSTKGHTAGLKTFILLSLASTSCMIIDRSLQLTFPICSAGGGYRLCDAERKFYTVRRKKPNQRAHHVGMALDVQYFRSAFRRGALHRRAHFGSRIYRDFAVFPCT